MWAVLCWLSILGATGKSVEGVVNDHWQRFGRAYYQRHDYEGLETGPAQAMYAAVQQELPALVGKPLAQAAHKRNATDVRAVRATTTQLSRAAEDSSSNVPQGEKPLPESGIVDRPIWRHEAVITDLAPGEQVPYRVVSLHGQELAASATFTLSPAPAPGTGEA